LDALASPVTACRICRRHRLRLVFDLGIHALSGRFPLPTDPEVPCAPLQLVRCDDCGLVQLGHDVAQTELYARDYGYRSGLNATMTQHLAGIARQAEAMVALAPGDTILDIASNDGTLLKSYRCGPEVHKVGIDPSVTQFAEYYRPDILRAPAFFTAATFRKASPTPKAKIVTSIAMFYDLPDPNAFVRDVVSILDPEGIWVMEQSDVGSMLQANAFDAICHEHLEYYGIKQIRSLLEDNGLRVVNIEYNASNGGSSRIISCHAKASYRTDAAALAASAEREQQLALDEVNTYLRFADRVADIGRRLRELLQGARSEGRRVHLYGASTKGNTLLQFFGIGSEAVDAASERNPLKWGRRTPGTNIPIISEADSRRAKPDYLLVLPWHFREEFIERERAYVEGGGRLIFPLPALTVYPS
jgi:hypothetical protein